MKTREEKKEAVRRRRVLRVRKKLRGTKTKPRFCVVKTNCHIEGQLIDDSVGVTLVSLSTRSKEFRKSEVKGKNRESAKKMGAEIARRALEKGIDTVVFDRGAHKFHGILYELATAARNAGLKF